MEPYLIRNPTFLVTATAFVQSANPQSVQQVCSFLEFFEEMFLQTRDKQQQECIEQAGKNY